MDLLQHLSDSQRELFDAASSTLELARGDLLIRRGEPGGDIFLLEQGALEVVDTRTTPEVILTVLEPGSMVGEMAFLDSSPRSADVRASHSSTVRRWAQADLTSLLRTHEHIAVVFYETVARQAASRIRNLSYSAVSGAIAHQGGPASGGLARVAEEADAIADAAKGALLEAETRLRQTPGSADATALVQRAMDTLQQQVRDLYLSYPDAPSGLEATRVLAKELHPYLMRSSLAERCMRRPQGITGTAEILAHVLVNTPGGDGQLGELLDRWFLDRPTLSAHRAVQAPIVEAAVAHLPEHRNRRVLLLTAGTGSLVASLNLRLADAPTVLTVVDHSRDALAFLDAGIAVRPHNVELQTVQENLAEMARGRTRHAFPAQDTVILPGLVEYMPDRIALSALHMAASLTASGGTVVVGALLPSKDQQLMDRLLDWPTIRRSAEGLKRLIEAAKLDIIHESPLPAPALLFTARKSAVTRA